MGKPLVLNKDSTQRTQDDTNRDLLGSPGAHPSSLCPRSDHFGRAGQHFALPGPGGGVEVIISLSHGRRGSNAMSNHSVSRLWSSSLTSSP